MGKKSKKERKLRELKRLRREKRLEQREISKEPAVQEKKTVEHRPETRRATQSKVPSWYSEHYKKMLIIPFAILLLAIILIGVQVATTGDFVNRGISLRGGLSVTLLTGQDIDVTLLQSQLQGEYPDLEIAVRSLAEAGSQIGVTIEVGVDVGNQESINAVIDSIERQTGIDKDEFSIEAIGSALGATFFRQTINAVIIAFIFMAVVVFFYYKSLIPSLAVVLAALSDIIIALAIFNLFGFRLSTAGVAAFLMIIGYAVDTNILLSTKVLKVKQGTVLDRVITAFKTGITMSTTTLVALTIALIFSQSEIIKQIMIILIIGLLADIMNTWLQNAGILRWYIEKKAKKENV
ncbi:MAG: protein translocase subunit SecF [archaeon]